MADPVEVPEACPTCGSDDPAVQRGPDDWGYCSDPFHRCPTCGSRDPRRYYGSCFDNVHSTVFDPRRPLDEWHRASIDSEMAAKQAVTDRIVATVRAKQEETDG